jgi:hypothetical protein
MRTCPFELKRKLPAAFPHEIMPVSPPTFLGSLALDATVVERRESAFEGEQSRNGLEIE